MILAAGSPPGTVLRSDGTPTGTYPVLSLPPSGPFGASPTLGGFHAVGSRVTFTTSSGFGSGGYIYGTDGTIAGTSVLSSTLAAGGAGAVATTASGERLFFPAGGAGLPQLWLTDGTAAGTALLKSFSTGPTLITSAGTRIFFLANDGVTGQELWVSDGTTAGTTVVDINPSGNATDTAVPSLAVTGSTAFVLAHSATSGEQLWATDGGTPAQVSAFPSGGFSESVTSAGSHVFLWHVDSSLNWHLMQTTGGAPADVLTTASSSNGMIGVGNQVATFLQPSNGTTELWTSDGTAGGTLKLATFPGDSSGGTPPSFLAVVGATLYLSASDGVTGCSCGRATSR